MIQKAKSVEEPFQRFFLGRAQVARDGEVEILAAEEGAAYGAALLAGVGVGTWSSVDEACARAVRVAARVEPDAPVSALMNKRYSAYRALYPALRSVAEAAG